MGKVIRIGLLGLGTVGTGVCKILETNRAQIRERVGAEVVVEKALVRDLTRPRVLPAERLTTDAGEILTDPRLDIIVEVMGGLHPAREYLETALRAGKQVVTANKELIAREGHDLLLLAGEKQLDFYFEASVAGAIPIIRTLKESLAGNQVHTLFGIINGTTNYILTRMSEEGQSLEAALAEAQARGYAEADPTSDVDGFDAAYKLCILASIAFGTRVHFKDIYREGIRRLTPVDLAYGKELGYTAKLLAIGKCEDGNIEVRVHPTFIPKTHPLAAVREVFNAIFLGDSAFDQLMFYGRGAGELPTGSAVVADIVSVARDLVGGVTGRISCTCFQERPVKPMAETLSKYYLRFAVVDRPGVLAAIAGVFARHGVSIASVIQKGEGETPVDLVFVTHRVREGDLQAALRESAELPVVHEVANFIRVEEA